MSTRLEDSPAGEPGIVCPDDCPVRPAPVDRRWSAPARIAFLLAAGVAAWALVIGLAALI